MLRVIVSGGFSSAYRQVLPEFERSTGIRVTTLSGASQGKGPETIAAQLGRGLRADVAILSREGLAELIAAGRIAAGTDVDLARAALGAAVRAGARKPNIGTVEGFKRALLGARVVSVPASTSGLYLTNELFPRLGIADQLKIKVMPRGSQSAALVAAGDADIAVQPISELLHEPGLDYVGPIPAELQLVQTFAAAIVAGSEERAGARRLIAFLGSGRAAAAIRNAGMQPVEDRSAMRTPSTAGTSVGRGMSLSEFIDRQWRWPWSLIPGRVDHETLLVADVIASIQAVALATCLIDGPWVIFAGPISMIALYFQVLISLGIFGVKLLATWPPVGHAALYATPQPIRDVSWPRAMRGFIASAAIVAVWAIVSHVKSAT